MGDNGDHTRKSGQHSRVLHINIYCLLIACVGCYAWQAAWPDSSSWRWMMTGSTQCVTIRSGGGGGRGRVVSKTRIDIRSHQPIHLASQRRKAATCLDDSCDILDIQIDDTGGSNPYQLAFEPSRASGCADLASPEIGAFGNATRLIAQVLKNQERCVTLNATGEAMTTRNVWIAYIGDSLLRSPFNHLVDMLVGREFGEGRNVFNLTTYHVDHRVCCRLVEEGAGSSFNIDTGRCTFTRAFDTAAYVRWYFRETGEVDDDNSDKTTNDHVCVTWQWNRLADRALRETLGSYTGGDDGYSSSPQLIIINPGLHEILAQTPVETYVDDVKQVLTLMQDVAEAQRARGLVPTRLVFQEPTSLVDGQLKPEKRALMNQTMVDTFYEGLLKVWAWTESDGRRLSEWLRVLPTYRLTSEQGRRHGLVVPAGDGVHYTGGYQAIVVRLHLYFTGVDAKSWGCKHQGKGSRDKM
jgi:hypothetical protein